jgi:hypothetical protein
MAEIGISIHIKVMSSMKASFRLLYGQTYAESSAILNLALHFNPSVVLPDDSV